MEGYQIEIVHMKAITDDIHDNKYGKLSSVGAVSHQCGSGGEDDGKGDGDVEEERMRS
ncbi:hypothetical protein PIB30_085765 [Stylosanthes scabra]|uniref:Uncharacterized protein n=1 Tax=Stylosanthes scabra TaxID=79078 RepID=A0ABU6VSM0_9FABA|nr:hypothetical protein [Stylosanthes scabra]